MLFFLPFVLIFFPDLIFLQISAKLAPFLSGLILFSPDLKYENYLYKIKRTFLTLILFWSLIISIIAFIRFPNDRYLSVASSVMLLFIFEQKYSNHLFYSFWNYVSLNLKSNFKNRSICSFFYRGISKAGHF